MHERDLATSHDISNFWWNFKKKLSNGCSVKEALKLKKINLSRNKASRKTNYANNPTDKRIVLFERKNKSYND